MKLLAKFWQNFKTQPDIWFFYGFLLTFTLSIRKVLYYYPINGNFNEYAGIYLYLSDIFLILVIITSFKSILESKSLFLSRSIVIIPLLLAFWSFISIIWSENHWLAFFRSIKILEFYLLFIYITQKMFHPAKFLNVPRGTFKNNGASVEQFSFLRNGTFVHISFLIISILGLIQSIIGIIQVFIQHSIGLFWLKESLISPEIPGVAKIILNGERYIRAYGLFPHPNILGGFLVFTIIVTIYLLKTTSPQPYPYKGEGEKRVPRLPAGKLFHVEQFWEGGTFITTFLKNSLGIQTIGLILTFSKSAILGLIIALAYLTYKKLFHVEQFKRKILITLILIALIAVITKLDLYSFFEKSLEERTLGYKVVFNNSEMFHACPVGQKCFTPAPLAENVPRGTFSAFAGWNNFGHFWGGTFIAHPFTGIGNGQFVLEMQKYVPQKLLDWQFQPAHNVFLLILSELGLVGLGLFVWFLWKLLRSSTTSSEPASRLTFSLLRRRLLHTPSPLQGEGWGEVGKIGKAVILAFIFIMLFDHYLWDIQQGQILLWLTFGLIAGDKQV